ncbi:MAG: restriction endonuclease subunit S [Bacteroidales bacterium]|nr:restriction endonuclease subunit S [Bacteroidales bacterium]
MPETKRKTQITLSRSTMSSMSPLSPPSHTPLQLPPGWLWVKLGEIGNFEAGGTPSKAESYFWNGKIPFVTGADITHILITFDNARAFLTEKGLQSGKTVICNPGTVLIVTRTRVGRVGIATEVMGASQDITAFMCGGDITSEYLCRFILSKSDLLISKSRGATVKGLTRDFIYNLPIPLPPLPEQKRIAAILKDQMAAIDKARKAAEERLEAVKALPAAFLQKVFPQPGQPLPQGWKWVKLGEVCEINPRKSTLVRDDNTLTTFIPMEAVDATTGKITAPQVKSYKNVKKGYTFFTEKDVLFAKITPCMQNGKHSIANRLIDGIGFGTTEFHVLRPQELILSEIIWYFLRQPNLLLKATEYFTGAVGQQRLPQDYLKNLDLPLPTLTEQKHIAAILKDQMAAIDKTRKAAEEELKTINALPAAILRKAFNGEL